MAMAEEVGIVMKLYDQVSPSLKSIAGNTKAFDKNMDDLEESLKAYRDWFSVMETAELRGEERGHAKGLKEGHAKGLEEGTHKANVATALRLRQMGLSVEDIQKATGLSEEEIREL